MKARVSLLLLMGSVLLSLSSRSETPPIGLDTIARLDQLAVLKSALSVGSVSSYDRTGGNDDGFSGTHSFVRKDGDYLVLADLKGPGVIYRFATPTPSVDMLEFRFEFLWPFWLLLRSVHDSFKYKGLVSESLSLSLTSDKIINIVFFCCRRFRFYSFA